MIGLQVTTARKAVTLLLSYLLFTKPLTGKHGTGLIFIAMGIVIKMLPDYKTQNRVSKPVENQIADEEIDQLINKHDHGRRPAI